MPRQRNTRNKQLPDNLYLTSPTASTYRYKHPITGKFHGMGSDKAKAIAAAKKLNHLLIKPDDLVHLVMSANTESLSTCIKRYKNERQAHTGLAASTLKLENYRLKAIEQDLGHLNASDMTVKHCSDWLDHFKGNAYTKHRGTLIKILAFAQAKGLVAENAAEKTLTVSPDQERKKRRPLTKEQFLAIRSAAPDWLQIAMDLALITLQRRGDLVNARYDDIEDNFLKVIQAKTEKHGERAFLRIRIGESLQKVLHRSQQLKPINCPYIVHRLPIRKVEAKGRKHHGQVRGDYLGKTFASVRDRLDSFSRMPIYERPTFHEIRGLGGAEYLRQGYNIEYVNLLMGHTSQKMTNDYTGQHINWTDCSAELEIG